METKNKQNQISILRDKEINKALDAFKASYESNKKKFDEINVKPKDVKNIIKAFSNKSVIFASTVIVALMIATPIMEFTAIMQTLQSMYKLKFFEETRKLIEN